MSKRLAFNSGMEWGEWEETNCDICVKGHIGINRAGKQVDPTEKPWEYLLCAIRARESWRRSERMSEIDRLKASFVDEAIDYAEDRLVGLDANYALMLEQRYDDWETFIYNHQTRTAREATDERD